MIRLPVFTMDKQHRALVTWDAGQLSIDDGSMPPDDVVLILAELNAEHRAIPEDATATEPEDFTDLQGVPTADRFLFHANFLPVAGYLPMFGDMEATDGELDQ